MCADGAKAPADRFGYSNALHGLYRVGRDEGLATFGRGMSANITRSVLMSTSFMFLKSYRANPCRRWSDCYVSPQAGSMSYMNCPLTRSRYSTAKHHLLNTFKQKDDVGTHTLASLSAGTVATTICAPADVLKSRIQSASTSGAGGVSFRSSISSDVRI